MFQKIVFSLLLISPFAAMAMEENESILHISIDNSSLYRGHSKDREKLEKAYSRQFPLNTIFFPIRYEEYSDGQKQFPTDIAYDDIKNVEDGELIKITIHGKERTLICKQTLRKGWCSTGVPVAAIPFHVAVADEMNRFKNRAAWSVENDKEVASLVQTGVIELGEWAGSGKHGENCSPYVKD